jgi:hypothetical protein
MVVGGVGVLAGKVQPALLQLADHIVNRVEPGLLGLVDQLETGAIEARVGGQPAKPRSERVDIGDVLVLEQSPPQRRGQVLGAVALVAPLVGRQVEEGRPRLVARRPRPVQGEGERLPARQRPHLLLADVVGPAAAVDALAATELDQRQEGPIDLVGVKPMVGAGAHRDHRAPFGELGVAGELPRHPRDQLALDAGDRLLPGRRAGLRILVVRRPLPGQALAPDPVVGEAEVEHRGDQVAADPDRRHAAAHRTSPLPLADVEAGQVEGDALVGALQQRQHRLDAIQLQVPLPGLSVTVAHRPLRHHDLARVGVEQDRLPFAVLLLAAVEVGGSQQAVGNVGAVALAQGHEQW